jgi:hypothetical protein
MPGMMFAIYPIEFIQGARQITIIAEAMSQVRRVYLDKPQLKIDEVPPGFYGHSVGKWEGDTLVVDTIGVKEAVLGNRDMPHSDQMRIHERIRMLTADFFEDRITVEDPVYLTQPWSFTWAYRRLPHYKMLEYVCDSNREYKDPETGGTRLRLENHDRGPQRP